MTRIFKPKQKKKDGRTWVSSKFYGEFVDASGKQQRVPLSTNRKEAKKLLDELTSKETRIRQGLELPTEQQPKSLKIKELAALFLEDMKAHLHPRTLKDYSQALKHLFVGSKKRGPWIPNISLVSELNMRVISRYQRKAGNVVAPRTVNRLLAPLSSMMGWALQQGRIDANPIAGIRSLPLRTRGSRAFEEKELESLVENSPQDARDVWTLLLDLGLRRAELASLQVGDIRNGQVTVRSEVAKNRRSRTIPATKKVQEILTRLLAGKESG